MDKQYITGKALDQLRDKYPSAYHFLLAQALEEEKKQLARELAGPMPNPLRRIWITERLKQLTAFD